MLKYSKSLVCLMLFLVPWSLSGCSGDDSEEEPKVEEKPTPVVNYLFQADPTIFSHQGIYYLIGTNDTNADNGYHIYSSTDMINWEVKGYALRKGDAFGDLGFWAPHVWEENGKFFMAYTANEEIAIATSNRPTGPYLQTEKKKLVSAYRQIDPFFFVDDDGKKYLYHVRLGGGNRIWVGEMKEDYSGIKPETATECITSTPGTWEHVNSAAGRVAEGPTVIKRNGLYYLFYSSNDFRHKDYAVGYAVSTSPYGPWKKHEGNPIIHQSITGHNGSGHGDIVTDKDGKLVYVLHTHNSSSAPTPRKTAIIRLKESRNAAGELTFAADKESFQFLNLGR